MDETELIARAQMRVVGRAAGLSRERIDRMFDAIVDASLQQNAALRRQPGRRDPSVSKLTGKVAD